MREIVSVGGGEQGRVMRGTNQMRVFQLFKYRDVVKLDVEKLVDGFQRAGDGDVVFELHGDRMVDEGLEEAAIGV